MYMHINNKILYQLWGKVSQTVQAVYFAVGCLVQWLVHGNQDETVAENEKVEVGKA